MPSITPVTADRRADADAPADADAFPYPRTPWIWTPGHREGEINASFVFARDLFLSGKIPVRVAITADSRYWLSVNGHAAAAGPARGYRDQAFFDTVDLTDLLAAGENRIEITVTNWGVDTFQYQRGAPGLLAAFYRADTGEVLLATDSNWRVRRASELVQRVPRISIQQGFEEHVDARAASDVPDSAWLPALAIAPRAETAERKLKKRATGNLGHVPRHFERLLHAEAIRDRSVSGGWSLPVRRLFSPFPLDANQHGMAGALAGVFHNERPTRLRLLMLGAEPRVWIDGEELDFSVDQDLRVGLRELEPGSHWVGMALCTERDHAAELAWTWDGEGEWRCPLPGGSDGVWLTTGPLWASTRSSNCYMRREGPEPHDAATPYVPPYGCVFTPDRPALAQRTAAIAGSCDLAGFLAAAKSADVRLLCATDFSEADAYLALRTDEVRETARSVVTGQFPGVLEIIEAPARLVFDLGEMSVGCFEMELECPAGTVVDGFFFEHLEPSADEPSGFVVQYLYQAGGPTYRNTFRYTACEGRNVFRSRQRRGGRYLMLVFRSGPARLLRIGFTEETYAPADEATFECSDERLNRIFAVARRTLLLCMEDTVTDCPTYEQAFWLGDARNEALFACQTFGAHDLARHCARLAAHSLDELPLVASQCPSGWDVIIPSFSFLWALSVWDVYWETGDEDFLRGLYPAFKANLDVAGRHCVDRGLFRAPAWNFFDWTPIDQDRQTVTHNSLLLAAALEAGIRIARVLGEDADLQEFSNRRSALAAAIDSLRDPERGAWRDALHDDGSRSEGICQHTSFLALLAGLAKGEQRSDAIRNCLAPPPEMTRVGSPNAMFFLLDALRREGLVEETLDLLRDFWGRMLDTGATTFWEMIHPSGSRFPTRSHCHGWSSSPAWLLPRLLFGLECVEPGWRRVSLRPSACGLDHARARIITPLGPLTVAWKKKPDGSLDLSVDAPDGVVVTVQPPSVQS